MKRKIIQLGSATLVASLPSKWAKRYSLKAGDEINIEEEDNRLIIGTAKDIGTEKKKIEISDMFPIYTYAIQQLYIGGADEIEVTSKDPKLLENLYNNPLPTLLGYEVVNQGKNFLHIKDLTGIKEFDFLTISRRIFLLLKQMLEEIIASVEKGEKDLDHIYTIDRSVNKFSLLCLRIINKRGIDPKKNPVLFHIIVNLEELGDQLHMFSKYTMNKDVKFSEKSIKFMKDVEKIFALYQKQFFKFDAVQAAKLDKLYRDTASTPGGMKGKAHRNPESKFDKLIESLESRKEARALIFFKNVADILGQAARNQLSIDL